LYPWKEYEPRDFPQKITQNNSNLFEAGTVSKEIVPYFGDFEGERKEKLGITRWKFSNLGIFVKKNNTLAFFCPRYVKYFGDILIVYNTPGKLKLFSRV
jgi:hypothetical protein